MSQQNEGSTRRTTHSLSIPMPNIVGAPKNETCLIEEQQGALQPLQKVNPQAIAAEAPMTLAPDIRLGRYRHYKGNLYEVIDLARHSETLEWMVVYRALYGDFGLWVRPAAMFVERVNVDGNAQPRFEYVSSEV